jgi:imidazolonepropionase-like amidohydrolase
VLSLALGLALGFAPGAAPSVSALSAAGQEPAATAAPDLFVKARRVIVRPGEELADAAVLVRNGRIVAVGANLAAPEGARTLEGDVVCAGFLDPWSVFGIEPEAANDERANAATRSIDSIDPYLDARLLQQLAEAGVTGYRLQAGGSARFGGIGAFVRLHPGVPRDESVVLEDCCVAASVGITRGERGQDVFDRVAELDRLVGALSDAQSYLQDKVEHRHELEQWEKDIAAKQKELEEGFKKAQKDREKEEADAKEKGKEFKDKKYKEDRRPRAPRFDPEKEALARCMNGELPLIVEAHGAAELRGLLAGTKDFDRLRLVIAGGTEALTVADELAERQIPVIVWPAPQGRLQDSGAPARIELVSADPSLAGALEERGVEVLIGSGGAFPSATRDLAYLAALAVGHGLEREAALAALTTRPARVLDVADRVGSLEAGKQADVLVLSGDPLSTTTRVLFVVSGGDLVYDGKD